MLLTIPGHCNLEHKETTIPIATHKIAVREWITIYKGGYKNCEDNKKYRSKYIGSAGDQSSGGTGEMQY